MRYALGLDPLSGAPHIYGVCNGRYQADLSLVVLVRDQNSRVPMFERDDEGHPMAPSWWHDRESLLPKGGRVLIRHPDFGVAREAYDDLSLMGRARSADWARHGAQELYELYAYGLAQVHLYARVPDGDGAAWCPFYRYEPMLTVEELNALADGRS